MTTADSDALRSATTRNIAAWHDTSVLALGGATEVRDGLWLALSAIPYIYFNAIGVLPDASATTVAAVVPSDRWTAVYDPWRDLDLAAFGFHRDEDQAWMIRRPEPLTAEADIPPGLSIEHVTDRYALADFEHASAVGFGVEPAAEPFRWHAPPLLGDTRLGIVRGCHEGQTVAGAMAFVHGGVVGIYSVSTVPDARRRGFATAVTRAALAFAPDLPAVLQPGSPAAEALYARLGFERFTMFGAWTRRAVPESESEKADA